MTIASIRSDIKTALDTVTDIGQTYDYGRYNSDWGAFLDLFKATISNQAQIRGWAVQHAGQEAVRLAVGTTIREHTFLVRGYLGLDDSAATEKTIANLAEAVCNALDDSSALHGLVSGLPGAEPASIRISELRQWHTVFCHYVEIVQIVREERAI